MLKSFTSSTRGTNGGMANAEDPRIDIIAHGARAYPTFTSF
jgi:hypothetical protein